MIHRCCSCTAGPARGPTSSSPCRPATWLAWSSERHHLALTADPATYQSLLPLLAQLPAPALLITGGLDPLTSAGQRAAFQRAAPQTELREFQQAGHFVHADEPQAYADTVATFVRANWPR